MQRRVVVLYLIFSLWVPIFCTPAMAESPPLFDKVTLNRGFSVLAAVPRESSGLDPPNVATSQVFSLGRKGQWSSSQLPLPFQLIVGRFFSKSFTASTPSFTNVSGQRACFLILKESEG